LGITSAEKILSPDYNSSVYDVYIKFAQKVIIGTGSLDILSYKQSLDNNFSLQSWTPDWWSTSTIKLKLLPHLNDSCSAAKRSVAEVLFTQNSTGSTILRARGFKFGQLHSCGNVPSQAASRDKIAGFYSEWRDLASPTSGLDTRAFRAFFQAISLGFGGDRWLDQKHNHFHICRTK
jgi:hypothetical protein